MRAHLHQFGAGSTMEDVTSETAEGLTLAKVFASAFCHPLFTVDSTSPSLEYRVVVIESEAILRVRALLHISVTLSLVSGELDDMAIAYGVFSKGTGRVCSLWS